MGRKDPAITTAMGVINSWFMFLETSPLTSTESSSRARGKGGRRPQGQEAVLPLLPCEGHLLRRGLPPAAL
eukprot:1442675-Pyramimonas_sp.AAC.1